MIERDYAEIAAACDRLLRAPDTSLARIAIPLLHLIDEHPGHIAQYGPLLPGGLKRLPPGAGSPARIAARAGRALLRSMRRSRRRLERLRTLGSVDVLIVSRPGPAVAADESATADDFYFGPAQGLLRERGATVFRILIDRLSVTATDEFAIWRQCLVVRRQLREVAEALPGTMDGAVARLASQHALSGVTLANLRLHAVLGEICTLLNPRIVITTYEGVAAERMVWSAARSGGRRPLCVGYQHTRILPRAHAIRRAVRAPGIDCDPDVILTLGEISQAKLAESARLGAVEMISYGSHRRTAPAEPVLSPDRPRRCLVLTDADERECVALFEFARECARRDADLLFTLRAHPVVSFARLRTRCPWLRELPGNVMFSRGRTLDEDCAQSRYCLYRASSAAIHAVLARVRPFYLARAGELPPDPLLALSDWHESVGSPEEFLARVAAADASPDPAAAQRAWSFCDRYVARIRPEALDELLCLRGALPAGHAP